MGTYLNPGNSGFARILQSRYVDKTELIGVVNSTINGAHNLTCISRPRRFGKSYAAQMLCAYYDRTVDSRSLFDGLRIAGIPGYTDHLNRYNVIYLDMAGIKSSCDGFKTLVPFLKDIIRRELCRAVTCLNTDADFLTMLVNAVEALGSKFIMIIDE